MNHNTPTFSVSALQKLESNCHQLLANEPSNLNVRLDLAWCLFMQALHEAGRESLLESLRGADEPGDRVALYSEIEHLDKKAYRLMKDCLRETFAVKQLSSTAPSELVTLHSMILRSGADQAFVEAEDEAAMILVRLRNDILAASDDESSLVDV